MKFRVENRYLIREDTFHERMMGFTYEARVLEISPSGRYMKLKFIGGSQVWEKVEDYIIIEELGA